MGKESIERICDKMNQVFTGENPDDVLSAVIGLLSYMLRDLSIDQRIAFVNKFLGILNEVDKQMSEIKQTETLQ